MTGSGRLGRIALAAALCALGVLPVLARAQTPAVTQEFTTDAGKSVEIGHYSYPKPPDCHDFGGGATIKLLTAPTHGKFYTGTGEFTYTEGIQTACLNKTVNGVIVYYEPESGFHGVEHIEFRVSWPNRTWTKAVTVTVN